MPALVSSAIRQVEYDWNQNLMQITFHSGGPYTFYHVPPEIYLALINAPSAGHYYHTHIRGRYGP